MTGSTMRSSTPPPELISSIARRVALSCDCSMAEVTPVWEKSTPTRHGASVSSLKLMTLTFTIVLVRSERPYVRLKETQIALPSGASSLPSPRILLTFLVPLLPFLDQRLNRYREHIGRAGRGLRN